MYMGIQTPTFFFSGFEFRTGFFFNSSRSFLLFFLLNFKLKARNTSDGFWSSEYSGFGLWG